MNPALSATIPARQGAHMFGKLVRLPEPIFSRLTLSVPQPPKMPTRTPDGMLHSSPALAIEWLETINILRNR